MLMNMRWMGVAGYRSAWGAEPLRNWENMTKIDATAMIVSSGERKVKARYPRRIAPGMNNHLVMLCAMKPPSNGLIGTSCKRLRMAPVLAAAMSQVLPVVTPIR